MFAPMTITVTDVVMPAIIAVLVTAATSLVAGWFNKPKTKAEAESLNAAASVSMSTDAREWTKLFVDRANAAEQRADEAEGKATKAEERANEIESALIECYGYVRELRDEIRRLHGTPAALPVRLEALWRSTR